MSDHWLERAGDGPAALDELGRRVHETLTGRVQWTSCSKLARLTFWDNVEPSKPSS